MDGVGFLNIFPPQILWPGIIVYAPFLPKGNVLIYPYIPSS